jgi:hypothetical protein
MESNPFVEAVLLAANAAFETNTISSWPPAKDRGFIIRGESGDTAGGSPVVLDPGIDLGEQNFRRPVCI